MHPDPKYFIPAQIKWINDDSPLKIMEKSRQVGVTHATDYRTVGLVSAPGARFDAFISTRDNMQAKLTLENCKHWAKFLHLGAMDLGEIVFGSEDNTSAYALEFANGRRIYALSSNPNALAGKSGHVILDEFALHLDQHLLYRVAKPVTTWGGTMTILSTHRGTTTLFYEFTLAATKTHPSDATLDDFRALRRQVNKAALNGRLSAYYLDTTWETRLSGFNSQAEPNVYRRLPDGSAILDGYPIVWTDVLQAYDTAAAADKPIAVFGAISFWWFGEHGSPRIDTSEHVCFLNDQLAIRFIEEIDFDYCAPDATAALLTAAS